MSLEVQLDVIRNADLYEKRLTSLKEAASAAKTEREKLTKAKDLDLALKQAKQIEEAARDALSQAKSESAATINHATQRASQIVKEAEGKANQIVASANSSITDIVNQVSAKQAELGDLNNEVGLFTQRIESLMEQYDSLLTELRTKESEKAKLIESISDKQRKLKALMVD